MSSSLMSTSPDFTNSCLDVSVSKTGLAFPARFLNNDGHLAITFTSLPFVTAGMVEVRRGVVFADCIVVISVSLVVWQLVENTTSDVKVVGDVIVGEDVDRERDEEVALDVGVDVDVRNDMVLDVGSDVVVGEVDVEMDVYVDMISGEDVTASVDVDVARKAVEVEVVMGADSEADVDTKVVGDVGVIVFVEESLADASVKFMLESDVDGVPLVVVVVIDLNSFTESDRVVVAPGNVDAVLETVVGGNINDDDETDTVEDDAVVADTVVRDVDVEGSDSDDADTVVADDDVDGDVADAVVADDVVVDVVAVIVVVVDSNVDNVDFIAENVVLHISSYSFLIFFSRSSNFGLHRAHFVKYVVFC
jgi:hypothetical protein